MESALAWIGQIIEWVGRFVPRLVIVDPTMAMVKYVGGKKVVVCNAGIHAYWPVRTTIDTYPIQLQFDDLRSQTLTTKDDVTIVVGGIISYRVSDIARLLPMTHNAIHLIRGLSLAVIHTICSRRSWEELKEEQQKGTLDTKLRNATRKALVKYGVDVEDVQLTDLARTRVYKVMQSTSSDEN